MIYKFMTVIFWSFLAAMCFNAVDLIDSQFLSWIKYATGVICILMAVIRLVEDR